MCQSVALEQHIHRHIYVDIHVYMHRYTYMFRIIDDVNAALG